MNEIPIRARHLRAPQGDGEVLIEPPFTLWRRSLQANTARFNVTQTPEANLEIAGQSLETWRTRARKHLIEGAVDYTRAYRDVSFLSLSPSQEVILSGHQPELFHPGVWLKNFVLHRFAERTPLLIPINLMIDNDVAGTPSIRIPAGSREKPHLEEFRLDESSENVPFEERWVQSEEWVRDFPNRLCRAFDAPQWFAPGHSTELLADRLSQYLEFPNSGVVARPLGELLARARHRLEQDIGLHTLELPLSHVAQTATFRKFALHLWEHRERFRDVYNQSLREYRVVNGIRSNSHPVPELAVEDDLIESPFWIWSSHSSHRERLFVSKLRIRDGNMATAVTGRGKHAWLFKGYESQRLNSWQNLESDGYGLKIRPRALITTMYARLFLSDLFIHGIGGAKYDELTDAIIRRFFGIEPPAYMTVTGTVRLPIPRPSTTEADVRNVKQLIREIRFHPERFLSDASPAVRESAAQFAAQKQQLLREHQFHFRQASREEFRALDDLNRKLRSLLTEVEIRLRDELHNREREAHANKILGSREFSFVLHPADELPEQLKKMAASS